MLHDCHSADRSDLALASNLLDRIGTANFKGYHYDVCPLSPCLGRTNPAKIPGPGESDAFLALFEALSVLDGTCFRQKREGPPNLADQERAFFPESGWKIATVDKYVEGVELAWNYVCSHRGTCAVLISAPSHRRTEGSSRTVSHGLPQDPLLRATCFNDSSSYTRSNPRPWTKLVPVPGSPERVNRTYQETTSVPLAQFYAPVDWVPGSGRCTALNCIVATGYYCKEQSS